MRNFRRIIIAVVVGFIVSVVAAWRLGSIVPIVRDDRVYLSQEEARNMWKDIVGPPYEGAEFEGGTSLWHGCTLTICGDMVTLDAASSELFGSNTPPTNWTDRAITCAHIEVGWPMRCLYGDKLTIITLTGERTYGRRGWLYYWGGSLPIGPLWIGLAVNSLLYGAFTHALLTFARRARRRARLDRKLCPECKYDLRTAQLATTTITTCSECGNQIPTACFMRPQQVWRWWMAPLILPIIVLFGGLFLAYFSWTTLRFHARWTDPIVTSPNALIVFLFSSFVFLVAWFSYSDRPTRWRMLLSVVVAIALTVPSFIAVFLISIHFYSIP